FQNVLLLPNNSPPFYVPNRFSHYRVDNTVKGAGSLGIIKKFDSPGLPSIAIKKFTSAFQTRGQAQLVLRELNLLRTIQHDNIVHLLGNYAAGGEIYHVTYYCGDPLKLKIEQGQYTMDDAKKWTRELLRAVQHLHSNKVIHRNLHTGNICIDANNKLTLMGFGKARVIDRTQNMTEHRGTHPYMPIEQLVQWKGAYDEKVDIWSVAVLLCEMVTGYPLFATSREVAGHPLKLQIESCGRIGRPVLDKIASTNDQMQLARMSEKYERKDFIQVLRDKMEDKTGRGITVTDLLANEYALRDFIEHTIQFDPNDRLSAQEALSHQFLLTLQPWEQQLPEDDQAAMQALTASIAREIAAAPI
ncbi:hypothetical protein PENTCL1PPCAC_5531, partial [Pristionchus entomophagus]